MWLPFKNDDDKVALVNNFVDKIEGKKTHFLNLKKISDIFAKIICTTSCVVKIVGCLQSPKIQPKNNYYFLILEINKF